MSIDQTESEAQGANSPEPLQDQPRSSEGDMASPHVAEKEGAPLQEAVSAEVAAPEQGEERQDGSAVDLEEQAASDQDRQEREGLIPDLDAHYKERNEKASQGYISLTSSGINLGLISDRDLEEGQKMFVPPAGYAAFAQKMCSTSSLRICIVAGEPNSSKMTTALYLAMQLPVKKPKFYALHDNRNLTILDIIHAPDLPANSVILFEEVFDRQRMRFDDLLIKYANLNENLRNAWFIFTVLKGPVLDKLKETEIPILYTDGINREQVIDKFIDRYFSADLKPDARARLLERRAEISHVHSLAVVKRLLSSHESIETLLDRLCQPKGEIFPSPPDAYTWFAGLKTMNHKFYAILATLFENLNVALLEEIYTISVHEFLRQGMVGPKRFIDPRLIGTYEMHEALNLQECIGGVLAFRESAYRRYIEEEQIKNFQSLLWSLINPDSSQTQFDGFIGFLRGLSYAYTQVLQSAEQKTRSELFQQKQALENLRSVIARTIAWVGIYHLYKLDELLNKLALDSSLFVALTTTFVLTDISLQREHPEFVLDLLHRWSRSGDVDLIEMAALSASSIYEAIARTQKAEHEEESGENGTPTFTRRKRWGNFLQQLRKVLTELADKVNYFDEGIKQAEEKRRRQAYQQVLIDRLENNPELLNLKLRRPFKRLAASEQDEVLAGFHPQIKQRVEEEMALLLNTWRNRTRLMLMSALWRIVLIRPVDMANLIFEWLNRKDTESQRWQMGKMALNYMLREAAQIEAPLLEEYGYPLLKLVPTILRTQNITWGGIVHRLNLFTQVEKLKETGTLEEHIEVDELLNGNALVSLIYTLHAWYRTASQPRPTRETSESSEEDEEDEEEAESEQEEEIAQSVNQSGRRIWYERVYPLLLAAINNALPEGRQNLREALFYWTGSDELMLSRMAHSLIVHAYAMDGMVLDLPTGGRYGVILIDGKREDRDQLFSFIQNVSSIAPLYLHWLGSTRQRYFSSGPRRAEETNAFGPDHLLLPGVKRPSLLMPIFAPIQGDAYQPDQCYYVAVFNREAILDLADLCGSLPSKERPWQNLPFASSVGTSASANPWRAKISLQPTAEYNEAPTLPPFINVVSSEHILILELHLRRRVISLLRTRPLARLRADLQHYVGEDLPDTTDELTARIEQWLETFAEPSPSTTSYDLSLAILWGVMILSLEDLESAIRLVAKMLQPENMPVAKPNAPRKVTSKGRMGMACTSMLLRFYGHEPSTLTLEYYQALLRLLPLFTALVNSYGEILPLFDVISRWARVPAWFARFNDLDGEFFESLGKLPVKEVKYLQNWLEHYRVATALRRLFITSKKTFPEFRVLAKAVGNSSQEDELRALLPPQDNEREDNELARNMYRWAMALLEVEQQELLDPERSAALLEWTRNEETLVGQIISELRVRQGGKVEALTQGEYFGLVLVDAASKEARAEALNFLYKFAEQRRQGKHQQVTLMLHQLGNKEIFTTVHRRVKVEKEQHLADKRKFIPVIGPLLERYPPGQIGFLLIVTSRPVIDYYDWAEDEIWTRRLWIAKIGNWRPYRGEMIALGGNTASAVEHILQRVTQGESVPW